MVLDLRVRYRNQKAVKGPVRQLAAPLRVLDPYQDVSATAEVKLEGRIVPFCAFNVLESLYRDYIQAKYKKAELPKNATKTFSPGEKYDRSKYILRIRKDPLYIEAYKGFLF